MEQNNQNFHNDPGTWQTGRTEPPKRYSALISILLVLVIFAGLQDQASFDKCPKIFRGLPIQLITAALMALALMGFVSEFSFSI